MTFVCFTTGFNSLSYFSGTARLFNTPTLVNFNILTISEAYSHLNMSQRPETDTLIIPVCEKRFFDNAKCVPETSGLKVLPTCKNDESE